MAAPPPGAEGDLRGTTALVTGASRGIGFAVAEALRRRGAWVAMVSRSKPDLERAAERIGGCAFPADASSTEAVAQLADRVRAQIGDAPDFVINAAGAFALASVGETTPEEFDRQIAANLRAPFLVMRAFLPRMLARGAGHLVSVGSVAGRVAYPGNGAYSASKFGLRGLHEVLAEEIRGSGVKSTLIEPAATDTPLWDPHDPDARPDLPSRTVMLRAPEVAAAVAFVLTLPAGVEVSLLALRSSR